MANDNDSKEKIEVLAIALLLALSISFMTIFNNAIINGGTTVVNVSKFGEMIPEMLVLHLLVWPIISVGLYEWHQTTTN